MLKRFLDCVLSMMLIVGFCPVFFVIGALVLLCIGRPIFFKQLRPGLHEKPFALIKFRTMNDLKDSNGVLLSDKERLTRFGRFLRSTSLDELPELWNVLKGEMSLVGPRPLLMEYLPLYSRAQRNRHQVRPGITGLAQVSGRNSLDWNRVFQLDFYYVRRNSLCLYGWILLKTILKVIQRDSISQEGQSTREPF
jgi:sugar transferase EpsL